eukprot:Plantae.Rhodophyta-Hildenbrandia_rubra.ctg19162.p1 GENE.Plantae.Rhodophyta-Hildenbrandia_rubra.ctg19162~~Plantae.Rhodophyta-Hildenbrandia_rubra.ctg19162.p1  ORF type:complete len:136 (+),score=21.59 Plantae.Rhodophyta-Hildenbrandia_rubra.ctg19162:46-408(+)
MVTAGLDRQVRLTSRVGHWADRALSQRKVNGSGRRSKKRKRIKQGVESGDGGLDGGLVKPPPVANLAIGNTRAKDEDFANIATCHMVVILYILGDQMAEDYIKISLDAPQLPSERQQQRI